MGKQKVKKCGEEKNVLSWADYRNPRQNRNLIYRHNEPNKPSKEEPLSLVLHKSPFSSVSTEKKPTATVSTANFTLIRGSNHFLSDKIVVFLNLDTYFIYLRARRCWPHLCNATLMILERC
jgi:hypothetical protein